MLALRQDYHRQHLQHHQDLQQLRLSFAEQQQLLQQLLQQQPPRPTLEVKRQPRGYEESRPKREVTR